jgi:H+/Cl- antiporter ClcA
LKSGNETERRVATLETTEGEAMNQIIIFTYLLYLCISIGLTVWVAQTLFKNGRVFLVDVFHGNESLADSVNHLLVVGFYLINFGYVSLALRIGYDVTSMREGIEALSWKVGLVLVVLGGMHFFNLYVFSRIRRRQPLFNDSGTSMPRSAPRTWVNES